MIQEVLRWLRELRAQPRGDSAYSQGYNAALDDTLEYVQDVMWEAGEDEEG